jgi:hypothetical protein
METLRHCIPTGTLGSSSLRPGGQCGVFLILDILSVGTCLNQAHFRKYRCPTVMAKKQSIWRTKGIHLNQFDTLISAPKTGYRTEKMKNVYLYPKVGTETVEEMKP